jgi:glycine/D-amino acid oxidase-like deaminating enzyme
VRSLGLAADEGERESLRAECAALRADGFAVDWQDRPVGPLADRYHGAIVHPGDGAIQPARRVRRLGRLAADAGADVHEHSRVESLDELDADYVVVATDGSGQGLLPALDAVVTPTRGQVIATEPLGQLLYGSRRLIGASSSAAGATPRWSSRTRRRRRPRN